MLPAVTHLRWVLFFRAVTEATAAPGREGPGAMNFHDFSGLVPVAPTAAAAVASAVAVNVHSSLMIF